MKKYTTIEKARMAAAKKQAHETNKAGWWKIKENHNNTFSVYFDSAKTRDGVEDDEHADASIYFESRGER